MGRQERRKGRQTEGKKEKRDGGGKKVARDGAGGWQQGVHGKRRSGGEGNREGVGV